VSDVVFTSTVEGLIRALGDKLDVRTHAKFKELGIPLEGKLQAAYPREAWVRVAHYAGELLAPNLPPEQQRVVLGRRFIGGFAETIVGKALLATMRVLGPRRALARLNRNLQTGNNYSRTELRETPEGLELWVGNAPFPEWYQGMVIAALEKTGAKEISVEPIRRSGDETTYRISFR
jgi:uncharacterized protein (TIGR02265 family)